MSRRCRRGHARSHARLQKPLRQKNLLKSAGLSPRVHCRGASKAPRTRGIHVSNHKSLQTHAFQCPQANYHSYARVIICRSRR
eukprot:UN3705